MRSLLIAAAIAVLWDHPFDGLYGWIAKVVAWCVVAWGAQQILVDLAEGLEASIEIAVNRALDRRGFPK